MTEDKTEETDLAPDADEPGDECPQEVEILATATEDVVPDEDDLPDPPDQLTEEGT